MKRNAIALLALLLAISPALAAGAPVSLYDQSGAPLGTTANPLAVTGGTGGGGGGSANAATTSNATDGQATSATNQQNVVFPYAFNGTTWDRVRGTGGSLSTFLSAPLPAGTNIIGKLGIDQTTPGTTNGTTAVGNSNIATAQASIGTTATLVVAARAGRGAVTIENTGTTAAYCGGSAVTATTGMLLPGVVGANLTVPTSAAVYCIVGTGTQTVTALETY